MNKRILVIHTFGLGDLILFTPFINYLKKKFKYSTIDFFLSENHTKQVLQGNKSINKIYCSDNSYIKILKKIYEIRNNNYDLTITTTGCSTWKSSLFSFLVCKKERVGEFVNFPSPFYTSQIKRDIKIHFFLRNKNIISLLFGKKITIKPKFFFGKKIKNKIETNKSILIHPGGNTTVNPYKRWEIYNYNKLIKILKKKKYKISIFLSKYEFSQLKNIKNIKRVKFYVSDNYSVFKNLALKHSKILGNDTGFMHIANTLNKKVFIIIPSKSVAHSAKNFPYGSKIKIIDLSKLKNEIDEVSYVNDYF